MEQAESLSFQISQIRRKSRQIVKEALQSPEPPDDSPFLKLSWDLDAGPSRLPDWFEENRVQGHTRLVINRGEWGFGTLPFQNAAVKFKELGAGVYARHVKTCFHNPWWPTSVPEDPPWNGIVEPCGTTNEGSSITIPENCNVVQEMVDDAHSQGLFLFGYYWHMSEKSLPDLPSQMICREPDCASAITDPRGGYWRDISETEYREIVLQRLLELAKMGVDGFYFDHLHLPWDGCWCSALAKAFTDETGNPPPTNIDLNDPQYRQFLDFKAYKIEDTFAYWKRGVKRRFPKVVFVISAPGIVFPHLRFETTNLARVADSVKNEYKLALTVKDAESFFRANNLAQPEKDIRLAFAWTLMRDSSGGRPPHIWERAFPNEDHALAAASALVTYGTVANMNVDERIIAGEDPKATSTPRQGLMDAFSLGKKVSPSLGHSRPLRWAAVHFSELSRNRRGGDLILAWQEVLWPAMGAFGVFTRAGLPVGIVNDDQLEHNQLKGYKILFLPNPGELTTIQRKSIRRFVARGGVLLKNDPAWPWSDRAGSSTAKQAFRREVQEVVDSFPPPVRVTGSTVEMHAVPFENKKRRQLVVALTNDFTWVQWVPVGGLEDTETVNSKPATITDAEVFVRNRKPPQGIVEAVGGKPLVSESIPGGYRVRLPEFQSMALLVIQE